MPALPSSESSADYIALIYSASVGVDPWQQSNSFSSAGTVFRAVRLFRIFRVFKLGRYSAGLQVRPHAYVRGPRTSVFACRNWRGNGRSHRAPRAVRRMRTSRRHVGQPGWQSWTPQAGSVREGGRVDAGHWVLSAACMCTDAQGSCPGHVTLPRRPLLSPPHSRQPPSTRTLHTQPPYLCATPTLHTHTQPPAPPHPRPRYSGVLSPTLGRRCSCCSF